MERYNPPPPGLLVGGETLNFDGGEIGPRYAEGVVLEHRPGL